MLLGKRIRSVLRVLWPMDLIDQLSAESKIAVRHARSWVRHRSRYRGRRDLRVNVGCGDHVVEGWINVDVATRRDVLYWDCRRSLPFDDGSVQMIFAEHVFEHFRLSEAGMFLSECRRCLTSGGILRLVVPDAGRYLEGYPGAWASFVAARPLIPDGDGYRDRWLSERYRTKMEFINAVFRQGVEHKYSYDAETLILHLRLAGFSDVRRQAFGQSLFPATPLDAPDRQGESLYIEAVNGRSI